MRTGKFSVVAARPFDIDLALDLIHQVLHVGAVGRMHGDAFAARDISDDRFAANRIAALGAVDHQIVDTFDLDDEIAAGPDGPRRRAELPACCGLGGSSAARFLLGNLIGRELVQNLARRVAAVAERGVQVFDLADAVLGRDALQVRLC